MCFHLEMKPALKFLCGTKVACRDVTGKWDLKRDYSEFQESLLWMPFLNPPCLFLLLLCPHAGSEAGSSLPSWESLACYPSLQVLQIIKCLTGLFQGLKLDNIPSTYIFSVLKMLAVINHNESRDIQMLEILYWALMPQEILKYFCGNYHL